MPRTRLAEKGSATVRFEVTWCSAIPKDEYGDSDFDSALYKYEHFPTFDLAVSRAQELLTLRADQFGSVEVCEQRLVPHPDLPRRHWWSETRRVMVDEPDATYTEQDMDYLDSGDDDA